MEISQKPPFLQLLTGTLAAYGKSLPERGIVDAWWANLQPYPIRIVEMAFAAYFDENGEFAPVPAGIAMRCKMMDGRPGSEEAWAIALTSRDEADTVVWTAETAEAFALCQSVFSMGDEVGARMAFKEAYARLVGKARTEHRPAQWSASLGWDVTRRAAVLATAATAGLLAAPIVAGLLPAPAGDAVPNANARVQLDRIRQMLSQASKGRASEADEGHECALRETAQMKRQFNEAVARYQPLQTEPPTTGSAR